MTFVFRDGVFSDIVNAAQLQPRKTNEPYISRALAGVKSALAGKSSAEGVDTVSGATCTSAALIRAAAEALQEAAQEPQN